MAKNIILLSDGTGNSSRDPFKTNIWRIYQALDLNRREAGETDRDQIASYDDGVGTESAQWLAIPGLAFGYGLKRNVLDLYTFLCRNYQSGDRIYCFGFSRGAFTARVLAGLICNQGLVQATSEAEYQRLAKAAFRTYRERYHINRNPFNPFNLLGRLWRWTQRKFHPPYDPQQNFSANVNFLGVFDTVAAYGLPIDELTRAWEWIFPLSFPDNQLSSHVDHACHALALDDERHSFHPELWTEEPHPKPKPPGPARQLADKINRWLPGLFPTTEEIKQAQPKKLRPANEQPAKPLSQRLLQVWFAGMHSDVGGSYPDDAMSFVPLEWMLTEAACAGLRFKAQEKNNIQAAANVLGPIHDSRSGLQGGVYRYRPRRLSQLTIDKEADVIILWPKIHDSVFERMKKGTDGYAPLVLPQDYEVYPGNQVGQVEHSSQAEHRLHQHEEVWDLVWKKRVVYFLTVLMGFALVLFPIPLPATSVCEGIACGFAPLVHVVGQFLPSMLGTWVKAYESHPGRFLLLIALMWWLIKTGASYQRRIFDTTHTIWKPILDQPGALIPPPTQKHENWVYKLRTNKLYLPSLALFRNKVLVPTVGFATVVLFLMLGCRVLFRMGETAGLVCSQATQTPTFFNNSICWRSGEELVEGRRYRLTLKALTTGGRTQDLSVGGFKPDEKEWWITQAKFLLFPLLRRDLDGKWFQPIARIGKSGADEYLLTPQGSECPNKLVAEITARRSGELFLYLNDVALPVPARWQWFYQNNVGEAAFTLELLDEKGEKQNGASVPNNAQSESSDPCL